jgi:hypothetical protein
MDKKKQWLIFIIIIICYIIYSFGPKLGLFLTPSYTNLKIRKAPNVRIDTDDPDYPLEFVSDGYKFTKISNGRVYWVWQYTVHNKSKETHTVKVSFALTDSDSFEIDSSSNEGRVYPGKDATIRGASNFPSYDLRRVAKNSWKISYR